MSTQPPSPSSAARCADPSTAPSPSTASPTSRRRSAACGSRARCRTPSSSSSRTAAATRASCGSSTAAAPATLTLPASRLSALTLEALCAGHARVPARGGRLRQPRAAGLGQVQPGHPARARARFRARRGPGDLSAAVGRPEPPRARRRDARRLEPRAAARAPVPLERPAPTHRGDGRTLAAYISSNPDGDDGGPLTDYDIIGSAIERTGLFALERRRAVQLAVHPAADPRARGRPERAAGRRAFLPRAARAAAGRPAGRVERRRPKRSRARAASRSRATTR